jgi:hypothetical protein
MEHGAVADGVGEIRRIAAARQEIGFHTENAALGIEACPVVDAEVMPLAGHDHVLVAVQAAFGGAASDMCCKCREAGPLRRLAFLAAEGAAHAAAFGRHHGGGHMQHMRHKVLHLGRVLRGTVEGDRAMLLRHGHAHLSFEIEVLLPADAEALFDHMRGGGNGFRRIAAVEGIGLAHVARAQGERILHRHGGCLRGDFDCRQPRGAARGLTRFGNHRENHLAVEHDLAVGQDRVASDRRRTVVDARNVRRCQHRDHARCGPHRIQLEPDDVAQGTVLRKARIDVDDALGLAHVVDICGRALHMESCTVMRQRPADGLRLDQAAGHGHHATALLSPTTRVAEAPATSISALRSRPCATSMR